MTGRAIDHVSGMEHGVIVFVGSGKQGKSCSLHSLLGLCQPDRPKCIVEPSGTELPVFPGYTAVPSLSDIPLGSAAVVEDVSRLFHSRGSTRDATVQRWLGTISHKSILLCLTVQSLAATDIEFLRSQDSVIVNKRMFEEDLCFERPEFRLTQAIANRWIGEAASDYPGIDPRAWCFFGRFNECVAVPCAPWWGYEHSHMLREARI